MVLETQENWTQALENYIQALGIDLENNEDFIPYDIQDLGRILKQVGTEQFESTWQQVIGEPCEGEIREAIWAARDAEEYYQLGTTAQEQQQYDEAKTYYQKAWEIFQSLGNWRRASATISDWGKVLEVQENWTEALESYIRALAIDLENNEDFISSDIQDLGRMLKQVGTEQFESTWQQVIGEPCEGEIREAIWATRDAEEYYHLGTTAQEQQQYEEAETHYQKAWEIFQSLGNWRQASATITDWGKMLETQENWTEALENYMQALAIDLENNEEWISSDIQDLGRILKQLGERQFKSLWLQITDEECSEKLYQAIQAASQENQE